MSPSFPMIGVGILVGGTCHLYDPVLNAMFALAELPQAPSSTGTAFAIGAIVTAVGTAIIQPYLKERGTVEKLTIAMGQIQENTKQIAELKAANLLLQASVAAKEVTIASKDAELSRAVTSMSEATSKLSRLSASLLVALGRIKPIPESHEFTKIVKDLNSTSVLLVDDDPNVFESWNDLLGNLGYRVITAATVVDGLAALVDNPDFVILDLMLPDGDGSMILKAIRDRHMKTKVIVTTGKADKELDSVRSMNPEYLLRKPVDFISELIPALTEQNR